MTRKSVWLMLIATTVMCHFLGVGNLTFHEGTAAVYYSGLALLLHWHSNMEREGA